MTLCNIVKMNGWVARFPFYILVAWPQEISFPTSQQVEGKAHVVCGAQGQCHRMHVQYKSTTSRVEPVDSGRDRL